MYTNKKRSENDQYNETSNHRQMKGYGGSGGSPRPRGSQALPLPPPPFICIWFDVSLYWSFSLRFLFVYISFYASNIELISFSMIQKMYVRIFCCETVNLIVFSMWIFLTVSTISFAGGGALFLTAFKHYIEGRSASPRSDHKGDGHLCYIRNGTRRLKASSVLAFPRGFAENWFQRMNGGTHSGSQHKSEPESPSQNWEQMAPGKQPRQVSAGLAK